MEQSFDIKALIVAAHAAIISHVDELTELDSAIGDGDHGVNMKRGLDAVLAEADLLAALPLHDALGAAGTRLVMTIGGASGPLFATFLMALGKELGNSKTTTHEELSHALEIAVEAVAKRGKSRAGQKTLLDVLIPVSKAFQNNCNFKQIAGIAKKAADATIPIQATIGRASYLGVRSIGHMDPGARSVSLIMGAVAEVASSRP